MKRQQAELVLEYQEIIDFLKLNAKHGGQDQANALRVLSVAQSLIQDRFLKSDLENAAYLLDKYSLQKPSPPKELVGRIALLARRTESISCRLIR